MKDHEIKEKFIIPNSTLYDWKKRNDYRKNIIKFLELITVEEVEVILTRRQQEEKPSAKHSS